MDGLAPALRIDAGGAESGPLPDSASGWRTGRPIIRAANPFSIELVSGIVDLGAGNEPYCRRIEASAQEKLGAAGAFGGVRAGAAAEAAS